MADADRQGQEERGFATNKMKKMMKIIVLVCFFSRGPFAEKNVSHNLHE